MRPWENRGRRRSALAAWTAAGGNLWVYGVGEQWEHLPELEKILDLLSDRGPTGPAPPGWTAPEKGSTAALRKLRRRVKTTTRAIQ